jgi:hypothetical protein
VWSRHLTVYEGIRGSNPIGTTYLFFNKALYYVMLHFYLQQPGIIKMFLLCNIPGKVPQFFFVQTRYNESKLYAKYHKILNIIEERCVCP